MADLEKTFADVRPLSDRLWGQLAALSKDVDRPRILFTSPEHEAGTTLVTAATALGIARNLRVETRLLETSFARPALADYLDIPRGPGLSDVLDHRATLDQSLQRLSTCPNLGIIPAGSPRTVLPGEFATGEMRELLASVHAAAQFTLIDAAPLASRAGTRLLLEHVDGVVIVARARSTRIDGVKEIVEAVEQVGLTVFGCVLNRYRSDVPFGLD